MIRIVYNKPYCRVTVDGHAHSDEEGKDLVCAAVSALTYTLAANVAHICKGGQAREQVCVMERGHSEISCKPLNRYRYGVALAMDAVCVGYELLAGQYPEYVRYEVRG